MTPEETEQKHLEAMGIDLGQQYHALWNDLVWLHMKWQEFEKLYAHSAERVGLLNRVAPTFFWQLQDMMWRDVLLHIARIIDPPESSGKKNLTIQRLPGLVPNETLRRDVQTLVDDAVQKCRFVKDRRNRHLAHNDLALKLKQAARTLSAARRIEAYDNDSCILGPLRRLVTRPRLRPRPVGQLDRVRRESAGRNPRAPGCG